MNGTYQFNVPAEAQGDVQVSIEFEAKTHAFAKDKEGNGIDDSSTPAYPTGRA